MSGRIEVSITQVVVLTRFVSLVLMKGYMVHNLVHGMYILELSRRNLRSALRILLMVKCYHY